MRSKFKDLQKTLPLFTYGTLQLPRIQSIFFNRIIPIHPCSLRDYSTLFIGDYLNIYPNPGGIVEGRLLWLNEKEWTICDLWEDYPNLYSKKVISAYSKKTPEIDYKALCYYCKIHHRVVICRPFRAGFV